MSGLNDRNSKAAHRNRTGNNRNTFIRKEPKTNLLSKMLVKKGPGSNKGVRSAQMSRRTKKIPVTLAPIRTSDP
jgi:hypothetical protein